jgi:signal transduction histidine kinase
LLSRGYRALVNHEERTSVQTLEPPQDPDLEKPVVRVPEARRRSMPALAEAGKRLFRKPIVQDSLIAAVLTAISLIGVTAHLEVDLPESNEDVALRALDSIGVALVLLQTVPLVWRRVAPVVVLCVTTCALFLFSGLGYFHSFASFGFAVALYTVAAHRDRRTSIPAGIASALVLLMIVFMGREPLELDEILVEFLIVGSVWFLGDAHRVQRSQMLLLEDRATRLEREREEFAQRAVAQERRVIARELHDVVAHNVSVIVAQSGAAQRIVDPGSEEAVTTLSSIEETGRSALVEMRRLMGFLRTDADGSVDRSPQPGLEGLDVLVDQVREAGLPVTLRTVGTPRPLPAGLDLSAFRIVQEALTNVLKHAGPAHADVTVQYEERRLRLTIDDDGLGSVGWRDGAPQPRYGHLGMRERVALFGGELRVGAKPGGGYRVSASMPLDREPA